MKFVTVQLTEIFISNVDKKFALSVTRFPFFYPFP